jgi:RNase H-like domain found in reverse transcriptase/Reverse transcriptase (RNA-dependent DNA polymerase)/Integrase zinc binding domain/Integrase core domain
MATGGRRSEDNKGEDHKVAVESSGRLPKPLVVGQDDMAKPWKTWLRSFDWYAAATGFYKKDPVVQVGIFMSALGPDVEDIYDQFGLTAQEESDVKVIRAKFTAHFTPNANISVERWNLFRIRQGEHQKFDEFLVKIKLQAKKCNFETLENELVKDMIVLGIRNDDLREKLLAMNDLNVESATTTCRAAELAHEQVQRMKSEDKVEVSVELIGRSGRNTQEKQQKKSQQEDGEFDCWRCESHHGPRNCPAYGKRCSKCGRFGHFSRVCRLKKRQERQSQGEQRKVNAIDDVDDSYSEEEYRLEYFEFDEDDDDNEEDWYEKVQIAGQEIVFKLDTGAQCNVLPKRLVEKVGGTITQTNTKRLVTYDGGKIRVLGDSKLQCIVKNKPCNVLFKVIEQNFRPILGRKACRSLKLIMRVDTTAMEDDFEELFSGLGCVKNFQYDIDIDENAVFDHKPARRIPQSMKEAVKKELAKMVADDVIAPVEGVTPITSNMVIVRKNKDKIRICLDPSELNKHVKRRHHPLTSMDEIATRLNGSKIFTLLDCRSGFWQIPVTKRTQKFLTFSTPWGRYMFKRLAFGLSSAPEVFQKLMQDLLIDIPRVEISMDDILIHAENEDALDTTTRRVLEVIRKAGLRLNKEKCVFRVRAIKFLGHIVSSKGLKIDPEKIEAIERLETPKNKQQLQRLLGMANYLQKFIPNLSKITAPLRGLTAIDAEWSWTENHDASVQELKRLLMSAPVLKWYDPNDDVTLSVDASSQSIGVTLLQSGQPVAYISKALTPTQQRYPQIEKEATAIRFGCQRLHELVYGKKLTIETDHKPLESIFKKHLHAAPPRLQRIMFDVMQYDPKIVYKKGTELHIADTLSRDCTPKPEDLKEESDFEVQMVSCMTKTGMRKYLDATKDDDEMQQLQRLSEIGFPPNLKEMPQSVKHYFSIKDQIVCYDGFVYNGERLIIPRKLRPEVMKQVHVGHLGIQSCLKRARNSVFWIGMVKDITNLVDDCKICQHKAVSKQKEPLVERPIPSHAFQKVSTDLFTFENEEYLVAVDDYSGFIEFAKLPESATSAAVIEKLKIWFAVHGQPQQVLSDNGPQYSSERFKKFSKDWNFEHITSSPKYPQSNGLAERAVQTVKRILKRCRLDGTDVQLAMLAQRNTPRDDGLGSPVQRLMSRNTRTSIDSHSARMVPKMIERVPEKLSKARKRQKMYADRQSKPAPGFEKGDKVLVENEKGKWYSATVKKLDETPRSYWVQDDTNKKLYRRNSRHLRPTKSTIKRDEWKLEIPGGTTEREKTQIIRNQQDQVESEEQQQGPTPTSVPEPSNGPVEVVPVPAVVTRSGRIVRTPQRLDL